MTDPRPQGAGSGGLHPAVTSILAVLVGAAPVALRLWGMGPNGQLGAVLVLIAALAIVGTGLVGVLSDRAIIAVGALLLVAATLAATPYVGRVPVPLAVAGTVLALVALRARPAAALAVLVLLAHGAVWWQVGSNAAAVVTLGAAAALCWLRRPAGPAALAAMDATLERMVVGAAAATASALVAAWRVAAPVVARSATRAVAAVWNYVVRLLRSPPTWVGLAVAVVTIPIFWRQAVDPEALIRGINDINSGLPRIDYIQLWPFRMSAAHPIWLVTIRILNQWMGPEYSTTMVSALSVGAAVTVLIHVARSRWDSLPRLPWPSAVAFGLGYVLLENPALLIIRSSGLWGRVEFAGSFARGTSYVSTHLWGTPTVVMSLPFAFATFWLVLQLLGSITEEGLAALGRRRRLLILTVFLTLLQPATTLALVPASVVYLLVTRTFSVRALQVLSRAYLVPGVLVVLAQVAFLSSNVSPYEQATWLWRPFWVWSYYGMGRPLYYLLFVLFAVCAWAGGRRYWRDPGVALAWIALGITVIPFFLLEQTTVADIPDGDLGVPLLMSIMFLFMSSLRFGLLELDAHRVRRAEAPDAASSPAWVPVLVLVLAIMFVAGAVDLAAAMGLVPET